MTLKEKIAFCTGADAWHTKAMAQYGVPGIMMADGPHGLRKQPDGADMVGVNASEPATCFPPAVTAGATWNRNLYEAEGEAIGREANAAGVSVVLGPGCNIKRHPLGGRNFEYLSEDPYVAGKMAAAFIRGLERTGTRASLKHFAANSQEYKRQNGDSLADERTLREVYLAPFEIAVKEGKPGTVMSSYNKINGIHASDHKWLLTDVLRQEWDFDGLVVTDWGGLSDRIEAFKAGCDLAMPGGNHYMEKAALKAVKEGRLSEADIDASVLRILSLAEAAQKDTKTCRKEVDWAAHHRLARTIAEQGAVLLKNEGELLPLAEEDFVLIGYMAGTLRFQGSGSSHINPVKLVNMTDALPGVPWEACCDAAGNVTEEELKRAAALAASRKAAVVVVGLPESFETEALDREHMRLPEGHNQLVEAVAAANPNTAVVLLGGGAMELPWKDRVKAILYLGLPGQAGGEAAANLLTGKANPSGKLTETWPLALEQVPSSETFGKKNPEYRESVYVGYRYYDKAKQAVAWPFGYGLSYTNFTYSDLRIELLAGAKNGGSTESGSDSSPVCRVTAAVTNSGSRAGAEVVQLYLAPPQEGLFRPWKELKGFARVELQPGERREVSFELDHRSFAVWTGCTMAAAKAAEGGWIVPGGTYKVQIGASSRDIRLEQELQIGGETAETPAWQKGSWYETLEGKPDRAAWEQLMGGPVPLQPDPVKGSFTMDSTCLEMKDHSRLMALLCTAVKLVVGKRFGKDPDPNDPAYKMVITSALDCPLRALVINAGGLLTDGMAAFLLKIANGKKKEQG
ncbi:MAG: glycosyl hydrolase [Clostridiales bacterium]|nr:glycosyl hydrolase [Clostridiales bacterium]